MCNPSPKTSSITPGDHSSLIFEYTSTRVSFFHLSSSAFSHEILSSSTLPHKILSPSTFSHLSSSTFSQNRNNIPSSDFFLCLNKSFPFLPFLRNWRVTLSSSDP